MEVCGASTPSKGSSSDDNADLLHFFNNLGLDPKEDDGFFTTSSQKSSCQSNNGKNFPSSPNFSSLAQTQEKDEDFSETQFKKGLGKSPLIGCFSSTQTIPQEDRIRAYCNFINGGDTLDSNMYSGSRTSMDSLNYMNQYNLGCEPNNFAGNYNEKISSTGSCFGKPSTCNSFLYQTTEDYYPDFDYMDQSSYTNYGNRLRAIESNGYYSGNGCYLPNGMASSRGLLNQQVQNLAMLAMTKSGSECLKRLLQNGNSVITKRVLNGVLEFLYELMTDQFGNIVFQKLIKKCDAFDLELIVWKITSKRPSFADAAFTRHGSNSIQELIKLLKKLDTAIVVTRDLSTRHYELMTHDSGRHVIQQCFTTLDDQDNEVLYEAVIQNFVHLATDRLGCTTLNQCIDSISEPKRTHLLACISDESVRLSLDPYGNYVVQHVLGLGMSDLTDKICYLLKGNYVRLSRTKHGSHLVEKCLRFSTWGNSYLVEDIKKEKKGMLEKLARDQFGNYVIQRVLEISKKDAVDSCEFLVTNLLPHLNRLEQTKTGKNVAKLVRELAYLKRDV